MSDKYRLGFIGTGIMGSAMAGHLLKAGYRLCIYNRSKDKASRLLEDGAVWANNVAMVAEMSDIVFTMVGLPKDVEEVILADNGVLAFLSAGGIVCDMTTSSPALAREIAARAARLGIAALDAPVTGGDIGAAKGTLSIFVGGERKAYEKILPILQLMGKSIALCGGPGCGQLAKLANQVNVAGVTFGVCESLLFAQEAGLDVAQWLDLAVNGSGSSASMNTRGRRLLAGDLGPGFMIGHFVKDLGLCLEECRRMDIVLPCTTLAEEFFRIMKANGQGKMGTQALVDCLAKLSGKQWRKHPESL